MPSWGRGRHPVRISHQVLVLARISAVSTRQFPGQDVDGKQRLLESKDQINRPFRNLVRRLWLQDVHSIEQSVGGSKCARVVMILVDFLVIDHGNVRRRPDVNRAELHSPFAERKLFFDQEPVPVDSKTEPDVRFLALLSLDATMAGQSPGEPLVHGVPIQIPGLEPIHDGGFFGTV